MFNGTLCNIQLAALIHDIIELEAGDFFCYDKKNSIELYEKEKEAAHSIYSTLPDNQKNELISIWEEFENVKTTEATDQFEKRFFP